MLKELISTGIDKLIAYADELTKVTILCIHKLIVTPAPRFNTEATVVPLSYAVFGMKYVCLQNCVLQRNGVLGRVIKR